MIPRADDRPRAVCARCGREIVYTRFGVWGHTVSLGPWHHPASPARPKGDRT